MDFTNARSVDQTEDLKAFERRLMEVISQVQPASRRAKVMLSLTIIVVFYCTYNWLMDPLTYQISLYHSLKRHMWLTISLVVLGLLLLRGAHYKISAPKNIAAGCRTILNDFNMSCDDNGKLILKPCTHYSSQ